jgi:hypothetical protein
MAKGAVTDAAVADAVSVMGLGLGLGAGTGPGAATGAGAGALKIPDVTELRRAYKALARRYHPDRNPSGRDMFEKVQAAYELLSAIAGKFPILRHIYMIYMIYITFFVLLTLPIVVPLPYR